MNERVSRVFILCDGAFIDRCPPKRLSAPLRRFDGWVFIAEFPDWPSEDVEGWQGITSSILGEDCYSRRKMLAQGLFTYLCDELGASTDRNVAAIIGDISRWEGKDPVELFDWLAAREPMRRMREVCR